MYLNKKLLVLVLFLVSLLAISAVSAQDNVTGDTDEDMGLKENLNDISSLNNEECMLQVNEDASASLQSDNMSGDVVGAGTLTFKDLYNEIKNGGEVTLQNNYEYDHDRDNGIIDSQSGGIRISNDLTIHGNGKTIDAKGQVIHFVVFEHALAIDNLTLVNGCETHEGTGGSIYVYSSDSSSAKLTAEKCNFNNNHAAIGGAICTNEKSSFSIMECTFSDNVAVDAGGAIIINGPPTNVFSSYGIRNCTFNNNRAQHGGAIFVKKGYNTLIHVDISILDSNFNNNQAYSAEGSGGAILIEEVHVSIKNSTFNNNSAQDLGGAISAMESILSVDGADFIGNKVSGAGACGGAVYASSCTFTSFTYSNFINNTVRMAGGSIYIVDNVNRLYISYSNFSNNDAKGEGGAIEIWNSPKSYILQSVFNENAVTGISGEGGAIKIINTNLNVNSTEFKDNVAQNGGAITSRGASQLTIVHSIFNTNKANGTGSSGGGIFILGASDSRVNISESNFTDNVAVYGGAIFNSKIPSFTVEDAVFSNNSAEDGGVIYGVESELNITNATFKDNLASNSGGAIYVRASNLDMCATFDDNSAYMGGAIYVRASNLDICASFDDNSAYIGGAILVYDSEVYISSNFTDNCASHVGGVLFIQNSTLNMFESNFINNTANTTHGVGGAMYAIYCNSLNVKNSYFKGNKAFSGGTIYAVDSSSADVLFSTFENNNAVNQGGAIFVSSGGNNCVLNISQSQFLNNNAENSGAAIYALENGVVLNIDENSYFNNNTANKDESGVCANEGKIRNSIFLDTKIVGRILILDGCELLTTPKFSFDYIYNVIENNPLIINLRESHGFNGMVNITVGGNPYEITLENGTGSTNITNLPFGDYKAILNFTKSNNFTSAYLESNEFKVKFLSYIDFANLINNAEAGSIVAVEFDYEFSPVYDSPIVSGIIIDKDITIIGNSHVLDMKNNARMFNIVDGARLTINNLTFINTLSADDKHEGSAINVVSGILNIIHANFTNNSGRFGAISLSNASSLTVSDSTFSDNSMDSGHGCAIYSQDSSVTVRGSAFSDNIADSGYGGAINVLNSSLAVSDSIFSRNHAMLGGAIYVNDSDVTISACEFWDNHAVGDGNSGYGGAVSSFDSNLTVKDSLFRNNHADNIAGAVFISNTTSSIDFCDFINNTSCNSAGAIHASVDKDVTVRDSNFFNNSAKDNAAIYELDNVNLIIANSYFINNLAANNISVNANKGEITDSVFVDDVISGSISVSDDCMLLTTSSFAIADIANAFNDDSIDLMVSESHGFNGTVTVTIGEESYEINLVNGIGGRNVTIAVPGTYRASLFFKGNEHFTYAVIESNEFTVKCPSFVDLYDLIKNATSNEIALDHDYKFDGDYDSGLVNGIVIDRNLVIGGNGHVIDAGGLARIFNVTGAVVKIENLTLIKGNAYNGGAIIASEGSNLTVVASNFSANNASSGGAIYSEGVLNIYGSTFENNIAQNGSGVNANNGEIAKSKFMDDNVSGSIHVSNDCIFLITPSFAIEPISDFTIGSQITIAIRESHGLNGEVSVTVGGSNYTINIVNGSGSKTVIPALDLGTYKAILNYSGDNDYTPATAESNNFTVKPAQADNSKIIVKQSAVQYTGKYSVTVYGKDGNVAKNTEVVFYVNGKKVKAVKTNSKGVATFNLPSKYLPGKKYTIKATALGKSTSKKVTVKQILSIKKVNVKKSAKKLVLTATLKKVDGKILKGKKVTFIFKGKKYTTKTNKKGVAKVTVKKSVLKKLKAGKKITYKATYLKTTVKKIVKVKK